MLSFILASKVLVTLETVLSLILADFIFGVLLSLRNSNFSFSKLPQFVETSLVPYIGGLLVLAIFSNVNAELGTLFFTIAATISAKFLADILTKAGQLFNGLQIQSPITVGQPQKSLSINTATDKPGDGASTSATETTSTI
ncbi:hypothetical protein DEAC_c23740 [Desulfosporosinus acididurans]|uniref:Holin n=1 Tax=Desulfosporosinus acididurans TaxID=476652 RepID=A0A0J1FQH4_9FIRM|nr:hypothetical protein [Desulfosporosinus acididurans]KLU65744.1 hypothetical protein DEAC_c23740 [Desulfosporosinus acididurans]